MPLVATTRIASRSRTARTRRRRARRCDDGVANTTSDGAVDAALLRVRRAELVGDRDAGEEAPILVRRR